MITTRITNSNNPVPAKLIPLLSANLVWLKYLCKARIEEADENFPPENYWIIEPIYLRQTIPQLKILASDLKSSTNLILFCDVPYEYYQECLAPLMADWKIKLLGLQNISTEIMADLINKLDFTQIKKIGIRNLDDDALWLLFNKLLIREANGKSKITVFCDSGISERWRQAFSDINTYSKHDELIRYNYFPLFDRFIKSTIARKNLQSTLDNCQALLNRYRAGGNQPWVNTFEELNKQNQKLTDLLAGKEVEIAQLKLEISDLQLQPTKQAFLSDDAEVKNLQSELKEIREDLNERISVSKAEVSSLKIELQQKIFTIKTLTPQLDEQAIRQKKFLAENTTLREDKAALSKETATLRIENTALNKEVAALRTDKDSLTSRLENAIKEVADLTELSDTYKETLNEVEVKNSTHQLTITALNNTNKTLTTENSKLQSDKAYLKQKLALLEDATRDQKREERKRKSSKELRSSSDHKREKMSSSSSRELGSSRDHERKRETSKSSKDHERKRERSKSSKDPESTGDHGRERKRSKSSREMQPPRDQNQSRKEREQSKDDSSEVISLRKRLNESTLQIQSLLTENKLFKDNSEAKEQALTKVIIANNSFTVELGIADRRIKHLERHGNNNMQRQSQIIAKLQTENADLQKQLDEETEVFDFVYEKKDEFHEELSTSPKRDYLSTSRSALSELGMFPSPLLIPSSPSLIATAEQEKISHLDLYK